MLNTRLSILALCVGSLVTGVGCDFLSKKTASGSGVEALHSSLLPDADLVFLLDMEKNRKSAVYRELLERFPEAEHTGLSNVPGVQDWMDRLGLTTDTVEALALSVSGLEHATGEQPGANVRLSGSAILDRVIDLEVLAEMFTEAMADGEGDYTIELIESGATQRIVFTPTTLVGPKLVLFSRPTDRGSQLFFGTENGVALALNREGRLSGELAKLKSSTLEGSYFWAAAKLPEALREEMRNQPVNPLMGPAGPASQTLQALTLSGTATDAYTVQLTATYGSGEDASAIQNFIQSGVLPMVMLFAGQSQPELVGILQGLRFSTEGADLKVNVRLTVDMLAAFQ